MMNKLKEITGWKIVQFSALADFKNGLNFRSGEVGNILRILGVGDFQQKNRLDQVDKLSTIQTERKIDDSYYLKDGDLVFVRSNGNKELVGRCMLINTLGEKISYSGFTIRARLISDNIKPEFINLLMQGGLLKNILKRDGRGTNISNLNQDILSKLLIPLPEMDEQKSILRIFSFWEKIIDKTEALIAAKERQFEWLVTKLISEIEKDARTKKVQLHNLLKYEQPTKYIVESTEYLSEGKTPVLTANKSFILGYTDEKEGIFNNTPVIIFDDFTTDSKLVKFPFKIKSSAMKILLPKKPEIDLDYIYAAFRKIKLALGGHKRYWISEFQFLDIPLPTISEQKRIAHIIAVAQKEITILKKLLNKYQLQKNGLMQKLLTREWHIKDREF